MLLTYMNEFNMMYVCKALKLSHLVFLIHRVTEELQVPEVHL